MSRHTAFRRGRALASLTAVAGLCLGTATLVSAPADSAEPAGDCATGFPVDELAEGQPVTGLTVTHATTPEGFTGEVLGVLNDAIGPDVDMIMVRLTSSEIDRVGIWQGMSGSPVYAADGRLIGAVSYGLAMGASPVAGVTPFAAMDDYLGDGGTTPRGTISVDRATARLVGHEAGVSTAKAAEGFEQLPMPLGVVGVGASRLSKALTKAGDRSWLPASTYAAGRARAGAAGADDIVAGGNLAASIAYGDVTMAGIGTATSVCQGRVVGFGHPMEWLGETTLGLHPADALYIQEDLVAGFKVANLADPVGTITDDRLAGITGDLGPLPDATDVTVGVTSGDRSRTGVTHVPLQIPDALASSTFYALIADHLTVIDGPVTGTVDLGWTITGTDDAGLPFELSSGDLYSSQYDLVWDFGFDIGDLVYGLAQVPGIGIDSIATTSDVRSTVSSYRMDKLEARQHGEWVKVTPRKPVVVRAGHDLVARATLVGTGTGASASTVLPIRVAVPKTYAGRLAELRAIGGASLWSGRMPRTLDGIQAWLADRVRNDEVQVTLSRGGRSYEGGPKGRAAGRVGPVQDVFGPADGVVRGSRWGMVLVK